MMVTPYPFTRTKRDYFAIMLNATDIQTTISSPDSTVPNQVTPISSILASELSSGTQSSITPVVDLATPETPPVNACYAPKKRKIEFKQFWKLKKLYYIFNLAELF